MSSAVEAGRTHAAEAAAAQVSSGIPTLVLQMLGIQQMSPPGATVTTLPPQNSQRETPHFFYTSDNQFVVSYKLESVAASKASSSNWRGDKNAGVTTNSMTYETSHTATPETISSVHNNQHIVGHGKTLDHTKNTRKEALIQVDDSRFHDVLESKKIHTPNTAASAAETTTATTGLQTQKPEAIPVEEKQSLSAPVQEKGSDSETVKHSHSAEVLSRYRRLLAQNRELKRRQLCRKCRHTPANVTLLPCGHLLYCQGCADDLTHCGACQKEILAEVKTYLC